MSVRRLLILGGLVAVLLAALGSWYLSTLDDDSQESVAAGLPGTREVEGAPEHPEFPLPKPALGFEEADPGDATYAFRNPQGGYWEAVEVFNFYSNQLPKAGWEAVKLDPDASAIGSILYHQKRQSYLAIDIVNQPDEVEGIELRMFLCPPEPRMTCGR